MINPLHIRTALGDESRQDQAGGSAQIRCHYRRGREPLDAANDRRIAFQPDLRTETPHLEHVHEAVLEDRLDDRPNARSDGVQSSELSLHVSGERRVRRRAHIDRSRPATPHVDLDPVLADTELRPRFFQLHEYRVQVIRTSVLDAHVAASNRARDQVSAALDPIR